MVTESIARRFPGDPIGWRFEMGDESEPKYAEIIGVVRNVGLSELGRALDGTVFLAGAEAKVCCRCSMCVPPTVRCF